MKSKNRFVVGVDEAGRGPLAGPVAVGLALVSRDFDWGLLPGVGDSKQVKAENREAIFRHATRLKKEGALDFIVVQKTALQIDRKGIAVVIREAIEQGLMKLACKPEFVEVLLDGALRAPSSYPHQKTIIKGDQKEKVIGLASILAKVHRDRYMTRKAREFPEYDFAQHKGYGTKAHRTLIKKHGPCTLHRQTFITKL